MSSSAESARPLNLPQEYAARRKEGYDSIGTLLAALSNAIGSGVSEGFVKDAFCSLAGLPAGTSSAQFDVLIPAEHPLRAHFRIIQGKFLVMDKRLFVLCLEHATKNTETHKQSTVKTRNRKIIAYAKKLRTELGMDDSEPTAAG